MDKESLIQFIIVCIVILAGWMAVTYIVSQYREPRRARPQPAAERVERPAAEPEPEAREVEAPEAAEAEPAPEDAPGTAPEEDEVPPPEVADFTLSNAHLRMRWTNRGAALRRLTLLDEKYKAPYYVDGERPPLELLQEFQEGILSDTIESVTFIDPAPAGGRTARYEVPVAGVVYAVREQGPTGAVFEKTVRDGQGHAVRIEKTVTLSEDRYHYEVGLRFKNVSEQPYELAFKLRGAAGIERETLNTNELGTRVAVLEGPGDYDIAGRSAGDLQQDDPEPNESASIVWAAVANHYFAAVTRPVENDWIDQVASELVLEEPLIEAAGARWDRDRIREMGRAARRDIAHNAMVVIAATPASLEPGAAVERNYSFIAVPKEKEILASYGDGLPGLTEFGFLAPLSRIAVGILNAIYWVIPNYGVAILVLTALVRLMLHPLTRKQQVSMIKMRKLQPQIQEIQRKYSDDKQKQTQEQMALFQKYGVHPLSGCFPLLLQLPVFIALFRALRAAIELRHAGFLFWIDDLSQPDTLFRMPWSLPIFGDQFNVLPLVMVAVMLLQQRAMPEAAGEQAAQQQKMMKWFPLFFVLLLYSFPSGLVLYWTTSTTIAALERWWINRHEEEIELTPTGARSTRTRSKPAGGGKGEKKAEGWLARLQRMAEDQSRQSRQAKSSKKDKEE